MIHRQMAPSLLGGHYQAHRIIVIVQLEAHTKLSKTAKPGQLINDTCAIGQIEGIPAIRRDRVEWRLEVGWAQGGRGIFPEISESEAS